MVQLKSRISAVQHGEPTRMDGQLCWKPVEQNALFVDIECTQGSIKYLPTNLFVDSYPGAPFIVIKLGNG